jgi:DNA polymerase-3 subunit beta
MSQLNATFDRDALASAFQSAAAAASGRAIVPILQSVKLVVEGESATLLATDHEVGIRVSLPVLEIKHPGCALLPIEKFWAFLRDSPDEAIAISVSGKATLASGERSKLKLPTEDPSKFPPVSDFSADSFHKVPARLLRELVRKTSFAVGNDRRYMLSGVLLEMGQKSLIAVGCDGRRLAKLEAAATPDGKSRSSDPLPIIPPRALSLIDRAIPDDDSEVLIAASENEILVKTTRAIISSKLLEGMFPKWRGAMPDRKKMERVPFLAGQLRSAVARASIATDEFRGVDFVFESGTLTISSQAAECGESLVEVPIAYTGEKREVRLDYRWLLEFLKALTPDTSFGMFVKDTHTPVVCEVDGGYEYMIQPMV